MNPDTERKFGVIYAIDCETGKEFEMGEIVNLDTSALNDEEYTVSNHLVDELSITFSLKLQPKFKLILFNITNNSIRMHGGKPLRKVKERFL